MDNRRNSLEEYSENSNCNVTYDKQSKKVESIFHKETEEVRTEGSADDMDLDETIDTHIGVRMDDQRHHIPSLPSDDNDEEDEDDDMGMNPVNILDSLPLEGSYFENTIL